MSERLACKAVGLARATYRRLPQAQTPSDPDAEMRAWLRGYAIKHPCHGFRRAWAALRYDERREVNKKKIHRLWREAARQEEKRDQKPHRELQPNPIRVTPAASATPPTESIAPAAVWASCPAVSTSAQSLLHWPPVW